MRMSRYRRKIPLKAQTEIISILLILAISITAVSAAYLWGVPLLQKGQSTSKVQAAELLMQQISASISDIAQNGGQKTITLNFEGPLDVSETDNAITYIIRSKKAGVATTDWTPMNSGNTFGVAGTPQNQSTAIYGTDKEGVIMARAESLGDEVLTTYKLAYRELDDTGTKEGRILRIAALGNNKVLSGRHTITISRQATSISPTQLSRFGGILTVTDIYLTLS